MVTNTSEKTKGAGEEALGTIYGVSNPVHINTKENIRQRKLQQTKPMFRQTAAN